MSSPADNNCHVFAFLYLLNRCGIICYFYTWCVSEFCKWKGNIFFLLFRSECPSLFFFARLYVNIITMNWKHCGMIIQKHMFVGVEKKEYTEMNVYTLKDDNTKNALFWIKEGKMKKRNRSISEDEFEDTNEVIRTR